MMTARKADAQNGRHTLSCLPLKHEGEFAFEVLFDQSFFLPFRLSHLVGNRQIRKPAGLFPAGC